MQATVLSAGITEVNKLMVQGTYMEYVCLPLNSLFHIRGTCLFWTMGEATDQPFWFNRTLPMKDPRQAESCCVVSGIL